MNERSGNRLTVFASSIKTMIMTFGSIRSFWCSSLHTNVVSAILYSVYFTSAFCFHLVWKLQTISIWSLSDKWTYTSIRRTYINKRFFLTVIYFETKYVCWYCFINSSELHNCLANMLPVRLNLIHSVVKHKFNTCKISKYFPDNQSRFQLLPPLQWKSEW